MLKGEDLMNYLCSMGLFPGVHCFACCSFATDKSDGTAGDFDKPAMGTNQMSTGHLVLIATITRAAVLRLRKKTGLASNQV